MTLLRFEAHGFRNLSSVVMEPAPGVNLISGANAAGKTSILEAVHTLARGRSFRTRHLQDLVCQGAAGFMLTARVRDGERNVPLGLSREAGRLQLRADGQPATGFAQMATQLPVLLLDPESHALIDGGPAERRRLLDWGVFHGQAGFLTVWRQYTQALRHRNAALRSNASDRTVQSWTPAMVRHADQLDHWRGDYIATLEPVLGGLLRELIGVQTTRIVYRRGWRAEDDLGTILEQGLAQDRRQAHTRSGPHRADFELLLDDTPPRQRLSRGQHKLLVAALVMALADDYRRRQQRACVLLVDDLPAELDADNRQRLLGSLGATGSQCLITAIEPSVLAGTTVAAHFVLEQGVMRPTVVN